ncbi:ThiF family adenylyltransferase [Dokdonella sp.]|uniref:ThiF family adenylyltransferase n=1 Tax=Dokdonella sp. TaxID=2291710 RepID=UPI001B2AFD58|nr:ThiF family adenylyltransferase [Dokdonella sp.]MBO9664549.1 ThiF family adenylyltransferase [Dokdonella sp.]
MSPAALDIVLLEPHEAALRSLLHSENGAESSAYVLFGKAEISADPWSGLARTRLISHEVIPVAADEMVSASPVHVTWSTRGFMRVLGVAKERGLVAGLVHTHPNAAAFFSEQDDRNEAELARTTFNKGVSSLASMVFGRDDGMVGRLWIAPGETVTASSISLIGGQIKIARAEASVDEDHFLARQAALFGREFNPVVRGLRVGVIGSGGTGSAVAMLLARLGVGFLGLVDKDIIDVTNLNRVHGSRAADVVAGLAKVDILAREIRAAGLGTQVVTKKEWVGHPDLRDLLRSCDVLFGCTDDHQGRLTLNRLAHYYGIPLIDVGLRMRAARSGADYDMTGRVSTIRPGSPCLMCLGVADPRRAAAEGLQRSDPTEFEWRKAEAYVDGGADPAPAVVTFTTTIACAAVDELIQGLTSFRGSQGMTHNRIRRFDRVEDRAMTCRPVASCPVCASQASWGRGDVNPFLGVIG